MEKRRRHRFTKRMTCEIHSAGQRSTGIVRDISEHGLFIQTSFNAAPNTLVHVVFPAISNDSEIRIEAGVARKRVIPRRLQSNVPSGLGLEVIPPRDEFARLVRLFDIHPLPRAASQDATMPPTNTEERAIRAYRFRMVRRDRAGAPQVVTIRCATEAGARARALTRVGAGWKIADVQPL